jgi:thiosulfate/3-mercaptopyruvate sulfurtransferase
VNVTNVNTANEVTTEELLEDYTSYKIVDVRTDDEFKGIKVEEGTTGGHMKDALLVRFTDMFRPDGTLKSNSELVRLFEAAGIKKTDKIATCCTGGIRSGYMQLVLRMLGYENSYNYAESVYRWSNTADAGTGDYWVQ